MSCLLSRLDRLASTATNHFRHIRWRHASALLNALSARVASKISLATFVPTAEVDSLRDQFALLAIGRMETILVHFRQARIQSTSQWIRQLMVAFRSRLRGLHRTCASEKLFQILRGHLLLLGATGFSFLAHKCAAPTDKKCR